MVILAKFRVKLREGGTAKRKRRCWLMCRIISGSDNRLNMPERRAWLDMFAFAVKVYLGTPCDGFSLGETLVNTVRCHQLTRECHKFVSDDGSRWKRRDADKELKSLSARKKQRHESKRWKGGLVVPKMGESEARSAPWLMANGHSATDSREGREPQKVFRDGSEGDVGLTFVSCCG